MKLSGQESSGRDRVGVLGIALACLRDIMGQ